jgi:cytochrome c biogenesis protein CcdA
MTEVQILLANWLSVIAGLLPFGYSFGAGMVSTVNPCGFALLPAYLSLYLSNPEPSSSSHPLLSRGGKALLIGLAVTLGFVVLFAFVGLIVWAGGQLLLRYLPWLGLLIGIILGVLGVWLLAGKSVYMAFPARLAIWGSEPASRGINTYFFFGIGYGIASLSCTLPVFLVVVGSAIMAQGILSGLLQFISYALGMGVVLISLTLSFALFKGGLAIYLRQALPYIGRVSGALLLATGIYLVYYWLTKGGLLS